MACLVRIERGKCLHTQCLHGQSTGYECVEVHYGCCECSGNCIPECVYNRPQAEADKAFAAFYQNDPYWQG